MAGLLQLHGEALTFRHDLARRAVEDALSPLRRRELNARVLQALEAAGEPDAARLVHHARRAADAAAIRRLAPIAARAAAAAGGHREALDHWEAALAAGGGAEALEGVAIEAYHCARMDRALEARRALLALHDGEGDELRAGDDERWLSRILWWAGQGRGGDRGRRPRDRPPRDVPGQPRAGDGAQRALAAGDAGRAPRGGDRARDARGGLARRIGDRETVAHALTNVGTTLTSAATSAARRCSRRRSRSPPRTGTTTTPPARW